MADIKKVLETIKKEKVRWIDIQFLDVPGYLQHITVPSHTIDEKSFTEGIKKLWYRRHSLVYKSFIKETTRGLSSL